MPLKLDEEMQGKIVKAWEELRAHAQTAKREYRKTATTARRYYDGPHDFVFEDIKGGEPTFKVTINKVYELLQLFGPMTYAQNPARNVENRTAGSPELAAILNDVLNYTPGEFGLKDQSKRAIDECLLHGRGVLFTGIDRKRGYVRSEARNTKDILIDPDSPVWYKGKYIMELQRDVKLWEISRMFGEKTAKRLQEKGARGSTVKASFDFGGPLDNDVAEQSEGQSNYANEMDLGMSVPSISLVHVYSKMGVGLRALKDTKEEFHLTGKDSADELYIIYEPTSKLVLYVGPWPIPFHADIDKFSWPYSFVDPAENTDRTWPISLIKPALGEQMFLDWGWSYAMGFIQASSRVIQVTRGPLDSKLELALKGNGAISIVEVELPASVDIDKVIATLEAPQLNGELLRLLQEVEVLFEKRTGMNEILYGMSQRAMRSATEAEQKGQFSRMRIDNIVDKVEDWQSQAARKEAIGSIWALGLEHLIPIVGPELAQMWMQMKSQMGDIKKAMAEYGYTVVSGSTRKRTPQARIDTATMMYDRMAPIRLQVGDLPGYNIIEQELLKAHSIPSTDKYILGTPPPTEADQKAQGQQRGPPQPQSAPEVVKIEGGEPQYGNPNGAVA